MAAAAAVPLWGQGRAGREIETGQRETHDVKHAGRNRKMREGQKEGVDREEQARGGDTDEEAGKQGGTAGRTEAVTARR